MDRRSPFVRKRVLLPLAAVAVVVVAGFLLSPGNLVRDELVRRLSRSLGRPVSVESVKSSLLPSPNVELRGLKVGAGGVGPLVSLAVDRVSLSLSLGPLLRRQVEITRLVVAGPRVVVQVPEAAAGSAAAAGGQASTPMLVNLRSLEVTGGAIAVRRADGAPLLEVAGLGENLSATLAPGGDLSLAGRTTVDSLSFHTPQGVLGQGLKIALEKDLKWQAAAHRLTVGSATLSLGDLPVALSGTVDLPATGDPVADLAFKGGPVQVASLLGFLPPFLVPQLAGVQSSGTVALAGTVKGRLAPPAAAGQPLPFAYDVTFDLADGRVAAPALPTPLSGLELHLRAHDDAVELARFAAATPRSRLAASGSMSRLLTTPEVALKVEADVDLAEAMALQPPVPDQPAPPKMSGRFAGAFAVSGPVNPPTGLSLEGAGRVTDVRMSGPDLAPAIDRIDGPFRLRGQQLLADGVVYKQGTTDLTVFGTVDNFLALVPQAKAAPPAVLAARVEGRLIDADQYAAPPGAKKEAASRNQGLVTLGLITGDADVTFKRVLTRGQELTDVAGAVRLDRGRLDLRGVRGALYGGKVDLDGLVDLSDPDHGKMDLKVKLAGVQAAELSRRAVAMSKFARLGGLVTGFVDGQATLKGALDDTFGLDLPTLSTNGQVEIRQARLAGSPLQKKLATLLARPELESVAVAEWLQPFRIEDGKLHVDGLKLTAAGIGVKAGGWQSLAGDVALGVELTVPQAMADGLRAKLPPAIAATLFDGSGAPLVVPVGMTGRWDDPQVQLDTAGMADAAKGRVRAKVGQQAEQVQSKVQDKVTEQVTGAANKVLDRLKGQPGDTAAAGADTAKAGLDAGIKSILKGLRGGKGK